MSNGRQQGVCRTFATSGSCRYGTRCKFSHDQASSSSVSPGRTGVATSSVRRTGPPTGVPRNVCQYFWTSGSCSHGFDCSFKHERQPAGAQPDAVSVEEQEPDFFSMEGLAVNNGSAREDHQGITPSEAHNHIKTFLGDAYQFGSASQVQGFVRILSSVNDRNKSWNSDSAQAFLDMIVNGNALLRIGEVLRFQPVSFCIGNNGGVLSFQKGYFPILEYFASNLVLKSTMHKNINHLYTVIENNYDAVHEIIRSAVHGMICAKSWKDPTPYLTQSLQSNLSGIVLFKTLTTVLYQYLTRFKDAVRGHPGVVQLVADLAAWFDIWLEDISASPARFDDPIIGSVPSVRRLTVKQLEEDISRLEAIVQRESDSAERSRHRSAMPKLSPAQKRQALISQLSQTYNPPGALRQGGARHDNDFDNISEIRIAPTHAEILCPVAPYLPIFVPDAPHHLPVDSMERHLDIQFRLLREELIATMRSSLNALHADLTIMWQQSTQKRTPTKLEELLKSKGGAYRTSGFDSVFFQLYTGVQFSPVKAERRDLTVGLAIDTPDHRSARNADAKKRYEYWEHSKRLQSGTLVALVLVSNGSMKIYLGVITSFGKDIAESSRENAKRVQVRISFFDAEVEMFALRREIVSVNGSTFGLLIDNSVMYEASRPFLERLKAIEPTEIPFARYIAHNSTLDTVQLMPPRYALVPQFRYNLDCLAKPGHQGRIQALDISRTGAIDVARRQLVESSVLDPSQVEAVVNTLVREVSLIQGPPGTGKSFTAKEILRVLFASGIRPIVLIAFTNHALDHMLTSVLDANITNKIVRLGSRSTDERIAQYTLDRLERVAGGASMLDRPIKRQYAVMKKLEENMSEVMQSIQLPELTWEGVESFLDIHYPDHADCIRTPPYWISALSERIWAEEDANGEWEVAGKKKKKSDDAFSRTLYGFWKNSRDIQFITPQQTPPAKGKKASKKGAKNTSQAAAVNVTEPTIDPAVFEFFKALGFGGQIPRAPETTRTTNVLLGTSNVWAMTSDERSRLGEQWEQEIRAMAYTSLVQHYESLREDYKAACKEYNDIRDETRRRLLSQVDLIACTTTGAAKLISLLSNVSPKVLMVEEAGQVLEAHILTSLVSSVYHLICIGDPQQLRPNLATFALSMDSERGKELFKFDRSLMERLADNDLPMSQINVQRRMRPTISHFIRQILYPRLEDNEIVLSYPPVQGMRKDVYFLTHTNKENGSDDSVSKHNTYEVEMIRDLVLYFLRQGVYNGAGDIAVLCAYLGQLQKVRAALKDLKIAVAVDERDQEQLARQGIDEEVEVEEVLVAKHVRLGTVDIFQGQEAKIVIVSLVRNSGTFETGSASIGFLKSSNRINVALSRAKHGLYVLGNAANLRRNETWSTILDDMEANDQIGVGFPIICPRHPHEQQVISKPGELSTLAPGGGCLLPCGSRLSCGHLCPSACHAAIDNHRSTKCYEPCNRAPCPRSHPCSRRCSDDCGKCEFPMYNVSLPCGHVADRVPCYMVEDLSNVKCKEKVLKPLPRCEHYAKVPCSKDPMDIKCMEPCGGLMSCCSKSCKSACYACQNETSLGMSRLPIGKLARIRHIAHPCDRPLYCQHACGLDCSQDHQCNSSCKEICRQQCTHHQCRKPCSEPCAPCMEPCEWNCPHQECPVVCGSICSRLPCDEPCTNVLLCGHPCPSICGEPCAKQSCAVCLPTERKTDIVDFIMQRRLEELDLSSHDTSERLITLECGHLFTVETLDGHCGMADYYEIDPMGQFIATKAPPVKYQTPPTCPACRGPITALRYGRVTKRATLDILEQNVASSMSSTLTNLSPSIGRISNSLDATQQLAKQLESDLESLPDNLIPRSASGKSNEPLDPDLLNQQSMNSIHGLSNEEAKAWYKIVKDLVLVYRQIVRVAKTTGAHVKAYEAALSTLYRLEMDGITSDPSRETDTPEQTAFEIVNVKIGQPPHKADTRFQIEAYILSLEIRFMLSQIASSRLEGLPVMSDNEAIMLHRQRWFAFVNFVLESCIADARKALLMAHRSSASRQAARCGVYILRAEFEQFRTQIVEERNELFRTGQLDDARRRELAAKVKGWSTNLLNVVSKYEGEYIRSRPSQNMAELKEELAWYKINCRRKIETWREECGSLERFVLTDKIYQPLSLQEREDIVKAFGFSHRGHFYNCENGHTFVITECGGAMESATCPECRAPIGGGGHRLHSSNTRAREFEEVAGRQGSLPGAFAWTRDA
ncbi:uncharacterized protein LAESUDRAFT_366011 [Laetiporus sulphureus 93-53]|uniref:P-loop containing nucleoside triphosphate hydrolase protein n=1 Tax=Laetiporus sulphureus 93-53 TaxID=1314785 RepID=A0A165CSH3_9APHY|nr:uncharacterized protein LAESUDRAFT_366011 [Laetiporus sulphureus 93-53]KZT03360.1 hypothetical protein LAESUDRAFT_366011 [Laetiporus sulphureus 93-53]